MPRGKRKPKEHEVAIRDLLDYSEARSLAEEMREWYDNEEGTSLENTQRHESVGEAADSLEDITNELESAIEDVFKLEDECEALKEILDTKITIKIGSASSRSKRASSTASDLEIAVERIQTFFEVRDCEHKASINEDLETINEKAEELGMVEFPGMFG